MQRLLAALSWAITVPVLACAQFGAHATTPNTHSDDSVSRSSPPHLRATSYSQEPFVIEKYATVVRFENDGTSEHDLLVRVRIQSDAGAQQWGTLAFSYVAPNERLDVRYVRVHKQDGTTVTAGAESIKDGSSPFAHDAPAFANCKELRITLPSLALGTILEYEIVKRVVTPSAPGEFWFEHTFTRDAIVFHEQLEINVPEDRPLKLASHDVHYEKQTANGRTIYRWTRANLTKTSAQDSPDNPDPRTAPPDVMLSTFGSWDKVALFYAALQHDSAETAPGIRAKANELVANCSSDLSKTEALYNFVSKQIRYINLPVSVGPSQPHSAAETLTNTYGDDQDKYVLLAALLRAVGLTAEPAFIPSVRPLDVAVPSPSQFNRILTVVPSSGSFLWLDTTSDVIPFQMLPSSLRARRALLVSLTTNRLRGSIIDTPDDLPFRSSQHVEITGRVSELGKLTAQAQYTLRGDAELVLRAAFHQSPPAQWNQIAQTILTLDGLHGEVSSVKPSDPTATHDPFQLQIDFAQMEFLDWSARQSRVALPLLAIGLPDPPENKNQPIDLGTPLEVRVGLHLDFPPNFRVQAPVGMAVARDYAEFRSGYGFDARTDSITAQRVVNFKMREIPASRKADYLAFSHAVSSDQAQALLVENTSSGAPAIPPSASADDLLDAGNAALHDGNVESALPLLKRAVEIAPAHKGAWNDLGRAYLQANRLDEAASAFRKQLELNPADEHAHDYLGLALERQQKYDDAAGAFRGQIQANPLDPAAYAALGEIFLDQHRYAEAVPALEKAAALSSENAQLEVTLGRAYLDIGANEKALAAFDRGAALSPTPSTWNDIACFLVDASVSLEKAEHYAQSALGVAAANLQDINLTHITADQMREVARLGAYWDTLGWVYFKQGKAEKARDYIEAAWRLEQGGEIGDHLAQIVEKLEGKRPAIHAYALALAAPEPDSEARARLTLLLGGNAQIDELVTKARAELEPLRTIAVGKLLDEPARADFLVLLSPGEKQPRVDDVQFLGGSEKLRAFAPRLRSVDFRPMFPDPTPVKLVRRATLECPGSAGECKLVLLPAGNALSAN